MARVVCVRDLSLVECHSIPDHSQQENYRDYDDALDTTGLGRRAYDYVSSRTEGPLAGLIWKEVRKILRKARLTPLQAAVTELHLLGSSDPEIAILLKRVDGRTRSRQAIRDARGNANRKLRKLPHLGVLTVLYEAFDRQAVNEVRADRFEERLKRMGE
jgi:hypothetical protein